MSSASATALSSHIYRPTRLEQTHFASASASASSSQIFQTFACTTTMARLSNVSVETPDTTVINLTVLLARLHDNLVTPDAQTDYNLRTSQRERDRVGKVWNCPWCYGRIESDGYLAESRICARTLSETGTRCTVYQGPVKETADAVRLGRQTRPNPAVRRETTGIQRSKCC